VGTVPTKKRVLVADDSATIRAQISALLADQYEVHSAVDGQELLNTVAQVAPAVILLDIEMPNLDGISVLRQLKANPATKQYPVVMVTRYAGGEPMELCRSLGCAGFILKPIDGAHLKKKVELLLTA
jgi:CheY-like chemotaxis protein